MNIRNEDFEVIVPNMDGTGVAEKVKVTIPVRWDEEVKEWVLTPEAHQIIDDTKARHMGLLLPAQLKELRHRYNFTQIEMGELFQIGDKSWTRWETGKQRPSRSINLLIRALYEGKISINYLLEMAGKPARFVEAEAISTGFSGLLDIWKKHAAKLVLHEAVQVEHDWCLETNPTGWNLFLKTASQTTFSESCLQGPVKSGAPVKMKMRQRYDFGSIDISKQTLA